MGPFDVDMRGLACLAEAALDAEMVVTVGAWCSPAPTAYLLGLGAKLRWLGSQSQVNLARSVPNGARRRHSRAEAQVCARCVRSCGESSTRPLLIYFDDSLFACGA